MASLKTGKQPATEHPEIPKYEDLRPGLVAKGRVPSITGVYRGHANTFPNWGMKANGPDPTVPEEDVDARENGAGCCTIAAGENETQEMLVTSGRLTVAEAEQLFNGSTAIPDYMANCPGYNPVTGENDNGCNLGDVMLFRQGVGLIDRQANRHKIGPVVSVEAGNVEHLAEVALLTDATTLGLIVHQAWMDQFNEGIQKGTTPVLTWVPGSPEEGGHCVSDMGRPDPEHQAGVQWEHRFLMTLQLLEKTCDEAYGHSTPEQFSAVTGKSYEGYDAAQVEEFLHLVGAALS